MYLNKVIPKSKPLHLGKELHPINMTRYRAVWRNIKEQVISAGQPLASELLDAATGRIAEDLWALIHREGDLKFYSEPASDPLPSYRPRLQKDQEQASHLLDVLPRETVNEAHNWLLQDPTAATGVIDGVEDYVPRAAIEYIFRVASKQVSKGFRGSAQEVDAWERLDPREAYGRLVDAAGGAMAIATYLLATLLAQAVCYTASASTGKAPLNGVAAIPALRNRMAGKPQLWTAHFEHRGELLTAATDEQARSQVLVLQDEYKHQEQLAAEGLAFANEAEGRRRLEAQDASRLRRKLLAAQEQIELLQRRIAVAEKIAQELRQKRTEELDASALAQELRTAQSAAREEANAKRQAEEALSTTAAERDELSAFVEMLLTAPSEVEPAAAREADRTTERASVQDELRDFKVVVVGGHEKCHARLRKVLRNAAFLHPDSKASRDVFHNAEAVFFLTNYCSHSLAWIGYQEVRRRGLAAGYASQENISIILNQLAELRATCQLANAGSSAGADAVH